MTEKSNTPMFELAHDRTQKSIKYFVYQEQVKANELSHLSNEILDNARMEVLAAQAEKVPFEFLSNPAKELAKNPEFVLTNEFRAKLFIADKDSEEAKTIDEFGDIFDAGKMDTESATPSQEDNDVLEIFVEAKEEQITDVSEPEAPEEPKETKPQAIIKKFEVLKPGHMPKSASKKYKAAIRNTCRKVLYEIVLNYAMEQLGALATSATPEALATIEQKLSTSSMVGTLLMSMSQGKDIDSLSHESLAKEIALAKDIDVLGLSILDNAEEFRQDNPSLTTGKELTVSDIKKYYRELGRSQDTNAGTTTAGKQVIIDALTPEVYATIDNSVEMQK